MKLNRFVKAEVFLSLLLRLLRQRGAFHSSLVLNSRHSPLEGQGVWAGTQLLRRSRHPKTKETIQAPSCMPGAGHLVLFLPN